MKTVRQNAAAKRWRGNVLDISAYSHMTVRETATAINRTPAAVRAAAGRAGISLPLRQPETPRDLVADMDPADARDLLLEMLEGLTAVHDDMGQYFAKPLAGTSWVQRAVFERLLMSYGEVVPTEILLAWTYNLRPEPGTGKDITRAVHALRNRLRPGVEIANRYGAGYVLTIRGKHA